MKSYHDLQDQTYKTVREKPFQRMVGKKTWRKWCALRYDAVKLAVSFKIGYDWSQNRGLLSNLWSGKDGRGISSRLRNEAPRVFWGFRAPENS